MWSLKIFEKALNFTPEVDELFENSQVHAHWLLGHDTPFCENQPSSCNRHNPQILIIVLLPNFTEDDKNNQFFQTDGTSQKLSRDEIMNLKAQGVSGKVRE